MIMVRSLMPGIEQIETCFDLYESSEYISSEMTNKSCFSMMGAMASKSSFSMIAPVGLFGNARIKTFVFSVIAPSSSSGVNLN